MKKILLFSIALSAASAAFAQLGGDGYYRVQNAGTQRYISIIDDKGKAYTQSTDYDLGAIETIKPFDRIASLPGTVIYVQKLEKGYNLRSQGTSTSTLTEGAEMGLLDNKDNTYKAYATKSGIAKYLIDENTAYDDGVVMTGLRNSATANWKVIPVSSGTDNYFGLTPEYQVGSDYYLTLFADFAFTFASSGMKAYYVDRLFSANAVLKEITGVVPAGTPVIVKCSSATAAGNKLDLQVSTASSPSGNLLGGVYFNIYRGESSIHKNRKAYNANTMRVLGLTSDGSIGFVKASFDYLPPNKAYLTVPSGAADELRLITAGEYAMGVSDVRTDGVKAVSSGIYTVSGVRVRESSSTLSGLPSGLYIVDGRKVLVP
jgi:hypothetical protein